MTDAPPAVLLVVPDPAGDVRGDGSYVLPSALLSGMERSVDLRELRAENEGGKLRLVIGLGGADNPWKAPSGFSAPLLDVFIKTDFGGTRELADTGFTTPPGSGWHLRYQISGFGTRAWKASREGSVAPTDDRPVVQLEGSSIIVNTNLPAGRYGYWVTSRVYSPLTPDGYLPPRVGGDSASLSVVRSGMPSAVDVLFGDDQIRTFHDRVLPISGELHDRRPLALLVLAGLALLLAVIATVRAWRKQ
ncbi:glucodextranase DOMON-like domain-containing protein [Deinococcus peraridilitoris]|uniref:Glucodextranase-like C-terminal domain-containing protein n=1 Tax=Deinococcus peraridilitoris (strain DSM 19664 / LMG 22246 / CIP 109416 / KR-200) TaxID=937777 RepID=K9ZWE6_DEIPD|nr:glucodextranase DOMON-like domain-containing protein [Deinococcus peraridilitoris]AFZ65968.1 protein of unknown function (DUF2223) [Deinococcus peraridilitoris DSM 19664]